MPGNNGRKGWVVDMTGWSEKTNDTNFIGGQTNNTILTRSYVIGLRLGF